MLQTYAVYVDNLDFYVKSPDYFPSPVPHPPNGRLLAPLGSCSGYGGYLPWDEFWTTSSYYVDGG